MANGIQAIASTLASEWTLKNSHAALNPILELQEAIEADTNEISHKSVA